MVAWLYPALMVGGAITSAIGGKMSADERYEKENERYLAVKGAADEYGANVDPIAKSIQQQASLDISGKLNPQDLSLQAKTRQLMRESTQLANTEKLRRMRKSYSAYGETKSPRFNRQAMEQTTALGRSLYAGDVQNTRDMMEKVEGRVSRGYSGLNTAAGIYGNVAEMKARAAGFMPTTTTGWGEGIGEIGATAMGFGANMLANQLQMDAAGKLFNSTPSASTPVSTPTDSVFSSGMNPLDVANMVSSTAMRSSIAPASTQSPMQISTPMIDRINVATPMSDLASTLSAERDLATPYKGTGEMSIKPSFQRQKNALASRGVQTRKVG